MRRAMICAAVLAALLTTAPSLGATTTSPEPDGGEYTEWRERLQRHDLFVGRDLLSAVRTAQVASRTDLRRSIRRMQTRWERWLNTTAEGRSFAFRRKVRRQVPAWGKAHLRAIAACESHNNPRAVGGGGTYRGLYQFSFSTWRVVGGYGDPAAASRWEQTWRAWLLLSRHGSGHWPMCG